MKRSVTLVGFLLLAFAALTYAQQAPNAASPNLLDEIRAHRSGVAIWWLGHNGWLIKSGDTLIGTDLVLEEPNRLFPTPISAADLATELESLSSRTATATTSTAQPQKRCSSKVIASS
jgi:hypothetical protein